MVRFVREEKQPAFSQQGSSPTLSFFYGKSKRSLQRHLPEEGETKCHCHRLPLWFRRLPDRLGEEPEVKIFRGLPRFLRGCTGVALLSCLNTFSADTWYVPTV
ncbi:hypothetical protein AVEN_230006-1 [Araneus ventricosus]|uniref:Uncharacterized protein n=1 Tax=Araneus ventricosus TaxID=182803 RepID=A0A4Y2CWC5_ARAVE|nr:hypothetical protein AVEN_230006-1 [Araneus ventricosus]